MRPNCRPLLGVLAVLVLAAGCASYDFNATPLQMAAGQGDPASGLKPRSPDLQKVKALVEGGAALNQVNSWGSALHSAVRYGTPEIIEYLVDHGANVDVTDDITNETPLIAAAGMGNRAAAEVLIKKGANVNAVSKFGGSPLTSAAYFGRYEVVKLLIEKGADLARDGGAAYLQCAKGMAQHTPRTEDERARYVYIATADLLVAKGVDVNAVDSDGWNALHYTAANGNPQVTRYFLKAGVNPNARTARGATPLAAASAHRKYYLDEINSSRFDGTRKEIQETTIPQLGKVIAILKPVTKVPNATAETADDDSSGSSLLEQAGNTLADCVKLKVSLKVCERLPWPASTGCSSLARAQFSNSVCSG